MSIIILDGSLEVVHYGHVKHGNEAPSLRSEYVEALQGSPSKRSSLPQLSRNECREGGYTLHVTRTTSEQQLKS